MCGCCWLVLWFVCFVVVRPGPISRVVTRVYCVTGRGARALRLRAVVGHVSPCALASCPSECSVWFLCPSRFGSARVLCRVEMLRARFKILARTSSHLFFHTTRPPCLGTVGTLAFSGVCGGPTPRSISAPAPLEPANNTVAACCRDCEKCSSAATKRESSS